MSNPCSASTCLNGNCPGCRQNNLYCEDPRCYPDCAGCTTSEESNSNNWILVTIILVLLGVLLVMGFIVGYSWYKDRQKANEPKSITVNKHTHTVVPTPAPTIPTIPVSPPVVSPMTAATVTISSTPVSYEGVDLTLDGIPKPSCNPTSL